MTQLKKRWRDVLKIHPAAEVFDPPPPDELRTLAEDIQANGLKNKIVLWSEGCIGDGHELQVLDGISRLDAMESVGIWPFDERGLPDERFDIVYEKKEVRCGEDKRIEPSTDPYAYVISANITRRHLDAKQKRKVIARLIAAKPELSDREIGKQVKADHKTVGAVRKEAEATGEASPVEKRIGADGKARKRPAKKAKVTKQPQSAPAKEPPARDDVGPSSSSEVARLRARLDELHAEKRQLEIKVTGFESEIEELKAENAELRKKLEAAVAGPVDDGIPDCLRRTKAPAKGADARPVDSNGAAQADPRTPDRWIESDTL